MCLMQSTFMANMNTLSQKNKIICILSNYKGFNSFYLVSNIFEIKICGNLLSANECNCNVINYIGQSYCI